MDEPTTEPKPTEQGNQSRLINTARIRNELFNTLQPTTDPARMDEPTTETKPPEPGKQSRLINTPANL